MMLNVKVNASFYSRLIISTLLLVSANAVSIYAQSRLKIVATTSIIGDALDQIVGNNGKGEDKAEVIRLMGPGVDPHAYKATPKNIQALSRADIIFYNGLHLEGKMADVLANFSKHKPVYAVSDGIDSVYYLGDLQFKDGADPHIWFDVLLWKEAVAYMSLQLQKIDPDSATYYKENTIIYLKKLDHLHERIQKAIQQVPLSKRVLITAHDAFTYFGRAYQIEVKGLQGISTVGECGLRDVTNLVDFIVSRKINAIFPENSIPPKPLQAVVEGCRKKGHQVVLGNELYSDALGKVGTPEGTYIGMVDTNVQIITAALK